MRVLVAGASGLIGREVVKLLKAGGHTVRTLSRDPARAKLLEAEVDEVRVADATVEGALAGICAEIEIVVSALGAPVSSTASSKQPFASVDRVANLALLAEAQRAGVRRFVYVGVFTTPAYADTAYVRAHTDVETAIRGSGLEHGFVRPTGVFGALASEFLTMAQKGPLPLIGNGSAVSNPVHERDVADAVLTAVTAPGSVEIDLGGPDTLTRRKIAELAFTALGKQPRTMAIPVWMMRTASWLYRLFNRRMGEFLRFVILASIHPCVAPSRGTRSLQAYFEDAARRRA